MKALDIIALVLLIVGGLNWLLVGLFEFDLVASIFGGQDAILSKVIYILVGLSALYCLKFFGLITDDDARDTAAADRDTANHAAAPDNDAEPRTVADDKPANRPVDADDASGTRTDAGDVRTTRDDAVVDRTDDNSVRNKEIKDTDRL